MKVLVIDDDPIVVLSCKRILEVEGHTVIAVDNADEGEALLKKDSFDILITDIMMPGRDGFDMIAQAKSICPDLPVVMMTGFLTAETEQRGTNSGADFCIAKPFTPEELLDVVCSL